MPLHQQVVDFLAAARARIAPDWPQMTPEEGRKVLATWSDFFGKGPELKRVQDRTIAGTVRVRIFEPSAPSPLPIVMYFHGGGWVLGNVDTHDTLCRRLSFGAGAVVVSVDYRLAPEFPFPAAFADCFAATEYISRHAAEFGGDANRLVVAGDSAGGNLAAAVALNARDRGGPTIRAQALIYPAFEPRCDTPSYAEFGEGHGLTRAAMHWFWRHYLGAGAETTDPCAAPPRAASLSGLPPAHVITAEFDVLRDEGEEYAARLKRAGIPTTLCRYDGMIHGFVHLSEPFDAGRQAVADLADTLSVLTRGRVHHVP